MAVQQWAGRGRQEGAAAVEGPDWAGEQLEELRVGVGEGVVDGRGGGEKSGAAEEGVGAGLEGEDVGEGVGVERLCDKWLVGLIEKSWQLVRRKRGLPRGGRSSALDGPVGGFWRVWRRGCGLGEVQVRVIFLRVAVNNA